MLTVGSLFSGSGAFERGFEQAGCRVAWQVEKDATARSVLARHWPNVPRFEDIRDVGKRNLSRVDIVIGGSPCQDFSLAGNRAGLSGERSGLFEEMARVVDELKPTWVVWENVPGIFSGSDEVFIDECAGPDGPRRPVGDDPGRLVRRHWMGAVLAAFSGIGYVGAWRVLDSQFFGTAQRRRRVFGVFTRDAGGRFGARDCAEILALTEGVRRYPPTRRKKRAGTAPAVTPGSRRASGNRGSELLTVGTLMANTDGSGYRVGADEAANGLIVAFGAKGEGADVGSVSPPLRAMGHKNSPHNGGGSVAVVVPAVFGGGDTRGECRGNPTLSAKQERLDFDTEAFVVGGQCHGGDVGAIGTLRAGRGDVQSGVPFVASGQLVRRLTPLECERLQGWQDEHTRWNAAGKELADGPRYRLIGNGVATPVARWIAERLVAVHNNPKRKRRG